MKINAGLSKIPIIAAIKTWDDINALIKTDIKIAFLLGGDLFTLAEMVKILKQNDKIVFIHIDLVDGLNKDVKAVKLLAEITKPHGILTTKGALIKTIKEYGLLAGQRCFILDRQSYDVAVKSINTSKPDIVELMPALMPKIIKRFCEEVQTTVIAGGLIEELIDVELATSAGAVFVSTSQKKLWEFKI